MSVPIVWMIRNVNAGSGPLGPRADASASIFTNISRAANEFSTWVATDAPPSFVRGVLVVAVFAAVVAGLAALVGSGWSPRQERSLLPLTAFVALYVVYLVVSVHLLTADYYPLDPVFDEAFKSVDLLVEELDMHEMLAPSSQMEMLTPYLKQLIAESAKPLQSIETDFAVDASGFLLAPMYAGLMRSMVRLKAGMIG